MKVLYSSNIVSFLGCQKVRISSYEQRICFFYLLNNKVNNENESIRVKRVDKYTVENSFIDEVNISNVEYFIAKNDNIFISTFDQPLIIDNEKISSSKNNKASEVVLDKFLYFLTYYYLMNEDLDNAEICISQTGDINAYTLIKKCKSLKEKDEIITYINDIINNKKTDSDKIPIKLTPIERQEISVLEVLESIIDDEESTLLWNYNYDYNRIGIEKKLIEDNFRFIKPLKGFGEVMSISLGDKKVNIGVKVKIDGQVVNIDNGLKLDGYIVREYNLVQDGKLNTQHIFCKLSNNLKRTFKRAKIIKNISNIFGEEIITLNLKGLNILSKSMFKFIDQEEIAKSLYILQELNCRAYVINGIIKNITNSNVELTKEYSTAEKIKEKYRVDNKGKYHPLSVENDCAAKYKEVYSGKIIEWKIERFPKKLFYDKWTNIYINNIKENNDSITTLKDELNEIKRKKYSIEYRINKLRIFSAIVRKEIFIWEDKIEKEKKENDNILNRNMIIGGKVKIYFKTINGIKFRQDIYDIIQKC